MSFAGRLIAGLLTVVMIVIFPLQYIAQQYSENVDSHIHDHTEALSNSIREKGYLDQRMYEDYVRFLDNTGDMYDVDLEDIHAVTGEEIDKEQASESTDFSKIRTDGVRKTLTLDKMNSKEKPSLSLLSTATHVHTDACYAGHRHGESGCIFKTVRKSDRYNIYSFGGISSSLYNSSGARLGDYLTAGLGDSNFTGYQYSNQTSFEFYFWDACNYIESYVRFTVYGYYISSNNQWVWGPIKTYTIPKYNVDGTLTNAYVECESHYKRIYYYINYGNSQNEIWTEILALGGDSYSSYNGYLYRDQMFWIRHWEETISSCNQQQDETPICNQVVTSIAANRPSQTIFKGGSIDTTVTATYLDEHQGAVNCSVSGFDPNMIGTQTVTLTYSGLVGTAKTYGTRTSTITVTVNENSKVCTAGLGHPNYVATLSACPVCTAIAGISANNQSFAYDGNHHELTIGNTTGVTMNAAYDTDPSTGISWSWGIGPTQVGSYPVHIYIWVKNTLTGVDEPYFVMERYVTIQANLTGITVLPSELTVERYTEASKLPLTITATYLNGSNRTITTGYSVSGYSPSTLGQQNVTISYTEAGITKSVTIKVTVTVLHRICPRCNNTYDFGIDDTDPGCPYCKALVAGISVAPEYVEVKQGESLPITVTATYAEGSSGAVTGWTSNYNPTKIGLQPVTIVYAGYAAEISVWVKEATILCPICGTEYSASEPSCPVCASTIISISAAPYELTVNQYDDINLTVTAYYRNGSSKVVTDWSIDCTTSIPGTFQAVVTYRNVMTKIVLTVVAESAVTCPICGTSYNPNDNPKGCPVCSNQIVWIEAYLVSGSNLVQLGSTPAISIVLIFRDTHRELIEEGYTIEDYNSGILGPQSVTIFYREFYTSMEIIVVDTLTSVTCPYGHVYYLNDDGTDPGCPYCQMAEDTGTVYYFDITYTSDILEAVYNSGKYIFTDGNYLTIRVTKKDVSTITRLQNLYPKTSLLGRRKKYIYGGEVSE